MNQLPAYEKLFAARRVLLLGAGGGYDVLGAVPLFVELRSRGLEAHFANISFTALRALEGAEADTEHACLYRITGSLAKPESYCPEAWLARWLQEQQQYQEPLWAFAKVGVRPLRAALAALIRRLEVDLLVLVDGGIDLTLRGDETSLGTPSEDLATLCAVRGITTEAIAMCIGFGAELREGIPHAQVLERFASLHRAGAYLGAVSLDPATDAGAAYQSALAFLAAGQQEQRGTHIHRVVLAAMNGEFGGSSADIWVSPLAAIRWFFDVRGLAASHLFLDHLEHTESIWDVTTIIRGCRKSLEVRSRTAIPI